MSESVLCNAVCNVYFQRQYTYISRPAELRFIRGMRTRTYTRNILNGETRRQRIPAAYNKARRVRDRRKFLNSRAIF